MPKMKTHRGAAKRFRRTGGGKLRRNRAFRSHLLEKKSGRRKRALARPDFVAPEDMKRMRRLLPYAW